MIKKIYSILIILVLIAVSLSSYYIIENKKFNNDMSNVSIKTSIYNKGDYVEQSFTVINNSNYDILVYYFDKTENNYIPLGYGDDDEIATVIYANSNCTFNSIVNSNETNGFEALYSNTNNDNIQFVIYDNEDYLRMINLNKKYYTKIRPLVEAGNSSKKQ